LECKSSENNKEALEEVTIDMMIPKIKNFKYLDWSYKATKISTRILASQDEVGMTKMELYI